MAVVHRLQLNLEGVVNGRILERHQELALDHGVLTCGYTGPAEVGMVMLAAALPAMALSAGDVRPVDGLAVHARTRLDLLGEHGCDFGTAVVVTETLVERQWLVCSARVRVAEFAMEIGERLGLPQVMARTCEVVGMTKAFASVSLGSTRGASYLADATAWLWNVERMALRA